MTGTRAWQGAGTFLTARGGVATLCDGARLKTRPAARMDLRSIASMEECAYAVGAVALGWVSCDSRPQNDAEKLGGARAFGSPDATDGCRSHCTQKGGRWRANFRRCGCARDPCNLPLSEYQRRRLSEQDHRTSRRRYGTTVTYSGGRILETRHHTSDFETGELRLLLDLPVGFRSRSDDRTDLPSTYVLAYRNDKGLEISGLDDPKLQSLRLGTFQTSAARQALARRLRTNVSLHVLSHNPTSIRRTAVEAGREDGRGRTRRGRRLGPLCRLVQKVKDAPIKVQPINLDDDEIPLEFEVGIGLRKIDWVLKYKFDLALDARKADVDKILRDYGVPLVQCSKCFVAGDLPSQGTYTKTIEAAAAPSVPIGARSEGDERAPQGLAEGRCRHQSRAV